VRPLRDHIKPQKRFAGRAFDLIYTWDISKYLENNLNRFWDFYYGTNVVGAGSPKSLQLHYKLLVAGLLLVLAN
jgi:hypothetical protein